LLKALTG